MPRLNKYYQGLQNYKDELIYNSHMMNGLSLEELGWIFGMTKQGIHKALKRHKSNLKKRGITILDKSS